MKAFNDKCKLNGYEDTVDWYPAWETYKFLYRNEELRTEKYEDLHDAAEYIIVSHQLSKDMRKSYLDVRDFYRFYVTLAKNEDEHHFVITDDVEKYLLVIANTKAERLAERLVEVFHS